MTLTCLSISIVFLINCMGVQLSEASSSLNLMPAEYSLDSLDDSLGKDWLKDSSDFSPGSRSKRAVGYTLDSMVINMTEIASQTRGVNMVDVGDSFTFLTVIDLPAIAVADRADLQIEIFAMDPNNDLAGFHICQAHMVDPRGANVMAIQTYPYYTDEPKPNYPTVIDKTTILFEQVHTNNISTAGTGNQIQIQFQAVVVGTSDLQTNTNYTITAGVDYGGDAYVWVGQTTVTTLLVNRTYDANIAVSVAPSSTINKGDGALFTIQAYITDPNANIQLGIFQPLGYNDLFNIGKITRTVGNAFSCSDQSFWVDEYNLSPSGLSVNNASTSYQFLINREALRNVSDPANLITFQIPIYVMNIDPVSSGVIREVAFALTIGSSKLWTAIQNITIGSYVTPAATGYPTLIYSNTSSEYGSVIAGDAALFIVEMSLQPGWSNFDVVLTGDSSQGVMPVGVRVVDSGLVAYFPPDWSVTDADSVPNQLSVFFGLVKNVDPVNPTTVVLEIAFSTESTLTNTTITLPSPQTVGGVSIGPLSITIVQNQSPASLVVEAIDFGWDSNLYTTGQAGVDLLVTVPSSAGADDLIFEAIPDLNVTNFSVRICRLRIQRIGEALPCIYHANTADLETYSKTSVDRPFDDFGSIDIGQICPVNNSQGNIQSNQFTANLVFELPTQAGITAGTYQISGGLKLDNDTIWVSSNVYNVQTSNFMTSAIQTANSTNATSTTPFVTAYPYITTFDRMNLGFSSAFDINDVLYIQYIIKLQPLTRGDYSFTVTPPGGLRVCKLVLTFIGDNMPCTEPPGPSFTGYENTEIIYAGGIATSAYQPGFDVQVQFRGLTNWGRDPIITDLTPDENSIQMIAFLQVMSGTAGATNVTYTLTPGTDAPITGFSEIMVSGNTKAKASEAITGTTWQSLIGPNTTIYKDVANLMQIQITVPRDFYGDLQIVLTNMNTADIVDFCDISVVGVGDNLPCLNMVKGVISSRGGSSVTANGETIYQSIQATLAGVCHTNFSTAPGADTITLQTSVRIRDNIASSSVTLQLQVIPQADLTKQDLLTIPLTVATPAAGDILTNSVSPDEVNVTIDDAFIYGVNLTTSQEVWIPFYISFPVSTTLKMEASLLLPTANGIARMHAVDMKFAACDGVNVLCTNPTVTDLRRSYTAVFEQTPNLTTFMQIDAVSVDLGYVINAGQSLKQGIHQVTDDQFAVQVLVQLTDHVLNKNSASFDIYFAVNFNDTIVVATQTVNVIRPPYSGYATRPTEMGDIVIDANQTNVPEVYSSNETVQVYSVIYHSLASRAEGYPTKIRVIPPSYLSYTSADSFSTNYTLNNSLTSVVTVTASTSGYIDFFFPMGITYADIVELNFTMTVDPTAKRPPGSGQETTSIVLTPICQQNVIDGYPLSPGDLTQCGSHFPISVTTSAPECFNVLSFVDQCQVQASSMINTSTNPFYSTSSTNAWSPAVRDGTGWQEYLVYDFLDVTRITQVTIGTSSNIGGAVVRPATNVRIQYSNVPTFFYDAQVADISSNNVVTLSQAVEARFVRILLEETAATQNAALYPIGVNHVVWQGCFSKTYLANTSLCQADQTVSSYSAQQYRHFAVDDLHDIIYFCDRNPYVEGMFCYANNRAVGTGNTWIELPRLIGYILGYSNSYGRVYFRDRKGQSILSSFDGQKIQLSEALPADIIPAMNIPGLSSTALPTISWAGTRAYTANFDGIRYGTTLLAQWKTCCLP